MILKGDLSLVILINCVLIEACSLGTPQHLASKIYFDVVELQPTFMIEIFNNSLRKQCKGVNVEIYLTKLG